MTTRYSDHPDRYTTVNELHTRPFSFLKVPCEATYLVIKNPSDGANRDRSLDCIHLNALLKHYGSMPVSLGRSHFFGQIGKQFLKWESHTEFVSYTAFKEGLSGRPFDPDLGEVFPDKWLADAPGKCLVGLSLRVEPMPEDDDEIIKKINDWFVGDSLVASKVLDGAAIVAGDFRVDPAGLMRFAIFVKPGVGGRRVGRIVQRLCEIETYRAMSMLGFIRARNLSRNLGEIDLKLNDIVMALDSPEHSPEGALYKLLKVSSELESLAVLSSFRFGATSAYQKIVNQRIELMREERFRERQTFAEFMMRRYDPAMHTVSSVEKRLRDLLERTARTSDLLRTRVDVERSAQNQKILVSMDRRADLQLRLQKTVEGLSVVAISYYAVNLAAYAVYPVAEKFDISKGITTALLTPLVFFIVWLMVRRLHDHFDQ